VTASTEGKRTLTWELYLAETLPSLLTEGGVDADEASAIVADIEQRGNDYVRGGRASRRALRVPFFDDVAEFEPDEAPIGCKADVAVVVRNSLLEDAHARSLVSDAKLLEITYLATGAFNAWSSQHLNRDEDAAPVGVFAPVGEHPRAYAALQALALAAENGGRQGYRMPDGPVPELPEPGAHEDSHGKIRRSALSALDEILITNLNAVAAGEMEVVFTSSLSRFSRDSTLLATVVEFVLAHGGTFLTTNFLLRPGEAFCRRPPLIGADSHDPLSKLTGDRLPGLQAKYVRLIHRQWTAPTDQQKAATT
jgi:hypothetical protein